MNDGDLALFACIAGPLTGVALAMVLLPLLDRLRAFWED